jgi:hypothetical protein
MPYNVFVLGPSGFHRHRIVQAQVERAAARRDVPPDWCYLHNFEDGRKPIAVRLPPGRGQLGHAPVVAERADPLLARAGTRAAPCGPPW